MRRTRNQMVTLMVFLGIGSIGLGAEPFAKGPYLGQTPPGSVSRIFAPGLISKLGNASGNLLDTFLRVGTHSAISGILPAVGVSSSRKTQAGVGQRLSV